MALKAVLAEGSLPCSHKWVKRDKKVIQVLHRVCPDCGREELHSEDDIDMNESKKIMKVK